MTGLWFILLIWGSLIFSGVVFVTQGTTGEGANPDGERLFDLPVGEYTMRLSMSVSGYVVVSPQSFTVTGTPADDVFDVEVELPERSEATDVRLCRCSGFFVRPDGKAAVGISLRFVHLNRPSVLGEDAVLPFVVDVRTDSDGHATVDLIRKAVYRVEAQGYEDARLETRIPDRPSANLADIVFPIVSAVVFTPGALALAVGGAVGELDVLIRYRSGLELGLEDFGDFQPVTFVVSDTDVATAVISGGGIVVTGVGVGQCTITAKRVADLEDDPIVAFPDVPLSGSLTVTVT